MDKATKNKIGATQILITIFKSKNNTKIVCHMLFALLIFLCVVLVSQIILKLVVGRKLYDLI